MNNALPEGYSIEAPTHLHKLYSYYGNDVNTLRTHYIVRNEKNENVMGTTQSGDESWWSRNIDAIESAWSKYNGALIDKHNEGLEGNMQTLGVYIVEDESHPEWRKEYHAECLKHEVPNILELEAITVWDEGYHVVSLICHNCGEPICPDEIGSKYRLFNEGGAQDDEEAHQWALEDGDAPHDGEYIESCELCREEAEKQDNEYFNSEYSL